MISSDPQASSEGRTIQLVESNTLFQLVESNTSGVGGKVGNPESDKGFETRKGEDATKKRVLTKQGKACWNLNCSNPYGTTVSTQNQALHPEGNTNVCMVASNQVDQETRGNSRWEGFRRRTWRSET